MRLLETAVIEDARWEGLRCKCVKGRVVTDELLYAVTIPARDRHGIHLLERSKALYTHPTILPEIESSPQRRSILVIYRPQRTLLEPVECGRSGYPNAKSPKLHSFSLDRLERRHLADSGYEIYANIRTLRKVPDHGIVAQELVGSDFSDVRIVLVCRP